MASQLMVNEQTLPMHRGHDLSLNSSSSPPPLVQEYIRSQTSEKLDDCIAKTIIRLSSLVSNIHKTMGNLRDDWHCDKSPSEYPIGSVLHLASEFTDIVSEIKGARITTQHELPGLDGPISPTFSHDAPDLTPSDSASPISSFESFLNQDFHCDQSSTASSLSSSLGNSVETIDGPTRLLVMSCYLSLRKLYDLVLTHFESHLSMVLRMPPSNGLFIPNSSKSRELQLGELPSTNETCSRIYTAIKLLLEILKSGEDMLGLPNTLSSVREPGHSQAHGYSPFLMTSREGQGAKSLFYGELPQVVLEKANLRYGNSMQEGTDGLCAKVQSLKRILLEKM